MEFSDIKIKISKMIAQCEETKNLDIITKNSISALLPINYDISKLQYSIDLNENIVAPIAKDSVLGKITYNIDGVTYSADLIANNDVFKSNTIIIILQIFVAIIILIILAKIISPKSMKKNKKKYNKKLKVKSKDNNDYNSIYKFKIE